MTLFHLPDAPPSSYLRWLAFWREVEQRMVERPSLEAAASRVSAPFLNDEVAQTISGVLVPRIVEQAREAASADRRTVAPTIEADPEVMSQVTRYVRRRLAFLTPDVCRAMDVEPLEPTLARLRDSVLEALEKQTRDSSP